MSRVWTPRKAVVVWPAEQGHGHAQLDRRLGRRNEDQGYPRTLSHEAVRGN
jgi:hypothetical protein